MTSTTLTVATILPPLARSTSKKSSFATQGSVSVVFAAFFVSVVGLLELSLVLLASTNMALRAWITYGATPVTVGIVMYEAAVVAMAVVCLKVYGRDRKDGAK